MLSRHIDLPPLSTEPQIIEYPDQTFALNWWPHLIYNVNGDRIYRHQQFAEGEFGARYHQDYLQNDLRYQKRYRRRPSKSLPVSPSPSGCEPSA